MDFADSNRSIILLYSFTFMSVTITQANNQNELCIFFRIINKPSKNFLREKNVSNMGVRLL